MASAALISTSDDLSCRAASRVIRSTLEDVEIRALESKLQLLDTQRQLSALRCQSFIHMLESSLGSADDNDETSDSDRLSRRSSRRSLDLSASRRSTWEEDLSFYSCPSASSRRLRSTRSHGASPRHHSKSLRRHSSLNCELF
ncbi:hypothetical protein CLOM_g10283 [Closterium sp. NIES-68]|nr:hypothetical protein CLOM_g10283 [Closterium sp. NIES-68]GJP78152.1 hypothetical protein CLOP_g8485 [Closterium sp. NIES-67]GJP86438.1 hypothetical protein CLOP_g16461 [Closterium sp. NIES-67]